MNERHPFWQKSTKSEVPFFPDLKIYLEQLIKPKRVTNLNESIFKFKSLLAPITVNRNRMVWIVGGPT